MFQHHRNHRPLMLLSVALLATLVFFAAGASTVGATAAPSLRTQQARDALQVLRASSCIKTCLNGSNPYQTGCAGSGASYYVVLTGPLKDANGTTGGYLQLWYSNTCGTNWTRVVTQVSGTIFMSATLTPKGDTSHSLVCFIPPDSPACTAIGGGNYQWLSGQYYLPDTPARSSGTFETAADDYIGQVSQY